MPDLFAERSEGVADQTRGVWDGLSSQEAMERYPDEWERFMADPYAHRAPRAESYHDLSGESKGCPLNREDQC